MTAHTWDHTFIKRGKRHASLPIQMMQAIQQSLLFKQMKKDCAAEGIEIPKNIMANDPSAHIMTPQEYLQKVEAGIMPPMRNHNVLKELAEKTKDLADQPQIVMMEFTDLEQPSPPRTPGPQN